MPSLCVLFSQGDFCVLGGCCVSSVFCVLSGVFLCPLKVILVSPRGVFLCPLRVFFVPSEGVVRPLKVRIFFLFSPSEFQAGFP